ncbi:MAG: LacI family DNA-binding transcriptional regulator [Lachnospiraceae bacterium]|nr:LacI family DNA-binding transcriptional regulator [Lachnospiraceae bacterium]
MNIYDVSQKAGVSIATVSRVINGSSNVSEKTRQKVLTVMKESGYTPNVFARGLGLNTMQTIGIMCSDSSDPFLANAVYYLEHSLRSNGYDSFLCCTGQELQDKKKYLKLLLSKRVDAIIMVGSQYLETSKKDNHYILDAAKTIPVMLINGYLAAPNVFCTLCDDYQAVYDATGRLCFDNRKQILYLYNSRSYSGQQKLAGYKAAIANAGLPADDRLILHCPKQIQEATAQISAAVAAGLTFDAVICAEDSLAVAAMKHCRQTGKQIPEEVSIIGYNNSELSICCEPELTTIDNHVETLCTTTVSNLMQVLGGTAVPGRTTLSNDLVIRGTTRNVQK